MKLSDYLLRDEAASERPVRQLVRPSRPTMASPNASRRREMDVTKLMMSDFEVHLVNESTNDMHVLFHGPSDSPYEGGSWKVHVGLPEGYPYKSPSIGFVNRIFHPNVDEMCALPTPSIPRVKPGRMT